MRDKKCIQYVVGKPERKTSLDSLDRRIILKSMLKE
jgi:hypothetical protein